MSTLGSQPEWVKSSLSFANGNCVEVADLSGGEIGVRNSREAAGAVLRFTPDEWHAFIGGVRNGEFDRFGSGTAHVVLARKRRVPPSGSPPFFPPDGRLAPVAAPRCPSAGPAGRDCEVAQTLKGDGLLRRRTSKYGS